MSHLGVGAIDTPRTAPIRATSALVEKVTGGESPGCPWRAFYEPQVGAVLRAHDWFEKGQASTWWGPDPERWLIDGVHVYQSALDRVRADVIETKRKKS